MKIKNIIVPILLFVLSFAIVHEYTFSLLEDEHCSVVEYVNEINGQSSHHGDTCDIHFEYHQAFLLSEAVRIPNIKYFKAPSSFNKETYTFKTKIDFFRPPIS